MSVSFHNNNTQFWCDKYSKGPTRHTQTYFTGNQSKLFTTLHPQCNDGDFITCNKLHCSVKYCILKMSLLVTKRKKKHFVEPGGLMLQNKHVFL